MIDALAHHPPVPASAVGTVAASAPARRRQSRPSQAPACERSRQQKSPPEETYQNLTGARGAFQVLPSLFASSPLLPLPLCFLPLCFACFRPLFAFQVLPSFASLPLCFPPSLLSPPLLPSLFAFRTACFPLSCFPIYTQREGAGGLATPSASLFALPSAWWPALLARREQNGEGEEERAVRRRRRLP